MSCCSERKNVKIVLRDVNCMPTKGHEKDSGYDLKSLKDYVIKSGQRCLVDSGINILLPTEQNFIWQAQIRPRSGLALKKGISITNSPGTVDNTYTGNIGVIIHNLGEEDFIIKKYDRVAQMVITRLPIVNLEIVQTLEQTDRGVGGFGSTGV